MSHHPKSIITPQEAVTLDGLFRQRVERSPDLPAYLSHDAEIRDWRVSRWSEVAGRVGRWQRALEQEGLRSGDRVGLLLRNGEGWVVFEQAALGLGLVVVPLYTEDRAENAAYILGHAGVRLLLVQDAGRWRKLSPSLAASPGLERILVFQGELPEGNEDPRLHAVDEWLPEATEAPRERQGKGSDLATIIYTSGTTGRPKGVMLSHSNLLSVAHACLVTVDCYADDRFLSFLPLSHTLERTGGYYLPMMAGASVAYARSATQLAEDMITVEPSVMIAVPRVFERIFARIEARLAKAPAWKGMLFRATVSVGWRRFQREQGRARWAPSLLAWPVLDALVARPIRAVMGNRLRLAVSGGAALPSAVARTFLGLGVPLLQGYGMTETSPVVAVNTPQHNDPRSVGPPLPGVEVRIGESDELLVRGPGVMLGYWENPEATAQALEADGWLHTGDQARLHQGYLFITGRLKDILVLSNGEKVSPGDMEMALTLDPLIDQAMLVGEGQAFLAAILVLNPSAWEALARERGLDPEDPAALEDPKLHKALLKRTAAALKAFPGYAKVRRLHLTLEPWTVENGLLTPTLKAKRNLVVKQFVDVIEALYKVD